MANITRFLSSPDERAASNSVRADPGAWSAADNAQMQSSEMMGDALQRGLSMVAKATESHETVDSLYAAQAKADLQVQYNDQLRKMQGGIKSGGAFENDAVSSFDNLALPFIKNAPNNKTRESLLASFTGMRENSYTHAQKVQQGINYQGDIQKFDATTNSLMGLGLQDPKEGNITKLKSQIETYAKAMKDKGYDALDIDKIKDGAVKRFDTALAHDLATKDPATTIEKLNSGAYASLGPVEEATLRNKAESQFSAQSTVLMKEHAKIKERLINDQALPGDAIETMTKAKAMAKYKPELIEPFKDLAALQHYGDQMWTRNLVSQKQEKLNIAAHAQQDPTMTSAFVNDMNKLLDNNIKAIEDDGLGYAARHNLVNLPPMPKDPSSPEGKAALKAREIAAASAEKILGIQVLPFTKPEIEDHVQALKRLSPIEKMQHLKAVAGVNPNLAPRMAEALTKEGQDGPLAIALQVFNTAPQVAAHILTGEQLIKSGGQMKPAPADERLTAASSIKGLFPGDPKTQDQLIHAADAYRASLGEEELEQKHVDAVAGVVSAGGFFSSYPTIPPKPNMSGSEFNSLTEGLNLSEMIKYGNGTPVYTPGQSFDPDVDSTSNYQFKPVDIHSGQYYVTKGGKALKTQDGQLYKIDLRKATS
jgi:hypothetical protein